MTRDGAGLLGVGRERAGAAGKRDGHKKARKSTKGGLGLGCFSPPADRVWKRASVTSRCLRGFFGFASVTSEGFVTLENVSLDQCL